MSMNYEDAIFYLGYTDEQLTKELSLFLGVSLERAEEIRLEKMSKMEQKMPQNVDNYEVSGRVALPIVAHTVKNILPSYVYYKAKSLDAVSSFSGDKEFAYVPRNFKKLQSLLEVNHTLELTDKTVKSPVTRRIRLNDNFQLKPYQIAPMEEVVKNFQDIGDQILEGETGYGKTYCLPYVLEALQQKTLIIVDRTLLAEQMLREISSNCDADVQILSKNYSGIADVNIATFQLLSKNPTLMQELTPQIGLVVVDECHIAAAEQIKTIVQDFPAKYRLGLSATPTRSDGLTEILYDVFGDVKVIAEASENLVPSVIGLHNEDFSFFVDTLPTFKKDFTKFLVQDGIKDRVLSLVKDAVSQSRQILIATDMQEVQDFYKNVLNEAGISADVINSTTKSKERAEILRKFDEEEVKVLLGFAVLEKGISIPRLDTIIHLSGGVTKEKVTQLMGRVRRNDKRKQHPIFLDMFFAGNTATTNTMRRSTYATLVHERKVICFFEKHCHTWDTEAPDFKKLVMGII